MGTGGGVTYVYIHAYTYAGVTYMKVHICLWILTSI